MSSLASSYADRDLLSTVHRGTAFEHRAMLMLRDMSMSLTRVGGRNDGGIDLQGWWWLPASTSPSNGGDPDFAADAAGIYRRRIRVLAQCKAERKKLGPNYVREMEGVLHRHFHRPASEPSTTIATPTIALLVSESIFTKATILCALSSPLPFLLLHLPRVLDTEVSSSEGTPDGTLDTFGSAIWNPALGGQRGVLEGAVDLRWELPQASNAPSRPSLWWRGTRLESWVPPSER